MQHLKIAVLAHIRHPIAEPFQGGMEAHAHQLCHSLADRGHDVTLFAAGDSDVRVPVRPLVDRHYDAQFPWHDFHGTDVLNDVLDTAFEGCLAELADYDVVHNNSLHRFPPRFAKDARIPMVTSLHVPPFGALQRAVRAADAPWLHYTACSSHQRAAYWPNVDPPRAHVVPNGIDLKTWTFNPAPGGSAIWVGRLTPTKAAHLAAEAAREAGVGLDIYGTIEHRDYFETKVRPLLSQDIVYRGHAIVEDLRTAVQLASVLVFTPMWDEPFGLVAAEALVSGTPVAAFDNGGVSEVVSPMGGVLASPGSVSELASAILKAQALDRRAVADDARARLSMTSMLNRYETLYQAARAGACSVLGITGAGSDREILSPNRSKARSSFRYDTA